MKRIVLAATALLCTPLIYAQQTERYIVVTRGPAHQALTQIKRDDFEPGTRIEDRAVREFASVNGFAANLTTAEVERLKKSANVEHVEPVVERYLFSTTPSKPVRLNDTISAGKETTPYGVTMLNAPSVWGVGKGAAKSGQPAVHVAIVDTGIDYKHPELANAYKGGTDIANGDNDPMDEVGHGTHVAGTIAASSNNSGVVGIAPEVDVYSVKVFQACGGTTSSTGSDALILANDWVIAKKKEIGGNWVMSLSLGGTGSSGAEQISFQAAADAGILIFAASGNDYDPTNPMAVSYPASYPSVVAVGAIDETKTVAEFSQRGPALKLVAPGVDVLSTILSEQLSTNDNRHFSASLPSATTSIGIGGGTRSYCTANPNLNGAFVFCGYGRTAAEFPLSVTGKIALVQRGGDPGESITFTTKMANARAAGAIGLVVYNNAGDGLVSMSLGNFASSSLILPALFIGQTDGEALKATPTATLNASFGLEGYALLDGTSMSTPHVSGAAALVWSVAPNASRTDVLNALLNTAHDLGDPGVDTTYGYGVVDAYAAAKQLAPSSFITGRRILRRGH